MPCNRLAAKNACTVCRSSPTATRGPPRLPRRTRASAVTCLHLADGGYFDNSGAQTNQDIVRALALLLDTSDGLDQDQRDRLAWLRQRLQLTAVFIRNGVVDATRQKCIDTKGQSGPAPAASAPASDASAATAAAGTLAYDPRELTCKGPLRLYTDLFGPMVTAKNSGGTGASGRLAESRLQSVIEDFNARAGLEAPRALPRRRRSWRST